MYEVQKTKRCGGNDPTMIRVTIDDASTLDLLRKVYSNRLNAASQGARFAMNSQKRKFKKSVVDRAVVDGDPVEGEPIAAIYYCCLPRCDWDAPIKSLQDAMEDIALACRNDRVIRFAFCVITRPGKGKDRRPDRKREIVVDMFNASTEMEHLMDRIKEVLDWGVVCWDS